MKIIQTKQLIGLTALVIIVMLGCVSVSQAKVLANPQNCGQLQVQPGHLLTFKTYARGVQIYRWNGAAWDFVAPVADLFASPNYQGKVGIHYAGPTWESASGSKVVAGRVADCAPNPNAIPWLLLKTVSAGGPGVFGKVTFIQRVNTTGGLRPNAPGQAIGMEARVPYTAEYYFFSAAN